MKVKYLKAEALKVLYKRIKHFDLQQHNTDNSVSILASYL